MQSTANICFDCERACGGCSWSQDFTPVPGWTATPVYREAAHEGYQETYQITACPLFERSAPRKNAALEWYKIMVGERRGRCGQ